MLLVFFLALTTDLYKSLCNHLNSLEKSAFIVCVLTLRLSFTCTTDENGGAQGHTGSLACVDPHRQRFYQSPLLKSYIIRQPGSLKISHKDKKSKRMKA